MKGFLRRLQPLRAKPPLLYHYTSSLGIEGILKSAKLRATDLTNMDDASELNQARGVLTNAKEELFRGLDPEDDLLKSLQNNEKHLLPFDDDKPVFGACFSVPEDSAFHWGRFAENGTGFALVFDTEGFLRTPWLANEGRAVLLPVLYAPQEQDALIREIFAEGTSELRTIVDTNPPPPPTTFGAALGEMAGELGLHGVRMLKEAFSPEREWRAVVRTIQGKPLNIIEDRVRGDRLARLVEMPIVAQDGQFAGRTPIVKIIEGPRAESIAGVLRRAGWPSLPIERSTVPPNDPLLGRKRY